MTLHWGDLKAPEPVCLRNGFNNPMQELLFRQGTALPWHTKQSFRFMEPSRDLYMLSQSSNKTKYGGIRRENSTTSSPLQDVNIRVRRKAVLPDSHLRSACSRGSNRGEHKAYRTTGKFHECPWITCGGCQWGAPFRNLLTRGCEPTDWPATRACWAKIAATQTFIVETESPWSSNICMYLTTTGTQQSSGWTLITKKKRVFTCWHTAT